MSSDGSAKQECESFLGKLNGFLLKIQEMEKEMADLQTGFDHKAERINELMGMMQEYLIMIKSLQDKLKLAQEWERKVYMEIKLENPEKTEKELQEMVAAALANVREVQQTNNADVENDTSSPDVGILSEGSLTIENPNTAAPVEWMVDTENQVEIDLTNDD